MLIGALVGLLALARPPTPAPMSDALTVIFCGGVRGEPFDATRARLGDAASHSTQGATESWVYSVDRGASACTFRVAQGRVIEIGANAIANSPDASMKDPYGVSLGSGLPELVQLRGAPREQGTNERRYLYPSKSGACWTYDLGQSAQQKDVVVTKITVFLNFNEREEDCAP